MENHEFKFIDLRIDWAFKYVYGSRGNEDLLLSLIDAILPEKHISKVELREQEQIPDSRKQRRSVFDVNCTTQSGESLSSRCRTPSRGTSQTGWFITQASPSASRSALERGNTSSTPFM